MNIIELAETRYDDGNLTITWVDSSGLKRKDKMSLRAQGQLLYALVAMPPVQIGKAPLRQPFVASNVRVMKATDGTTGLEVTIGPQITIQIVLPDPLPSQLIGMLSGDPQYWQEPQKH